MQQLFTIWSFLVITLTCMTITLAQDDGDSKLGDGDKKNEKSGDLKNYWGGSHGTGDDDTCSFRREYGDCTEHLTRWYFDRKDGFCRQFIYSGCGGNKNNFEWRMRCESKCNPVFTKDDDDKKNDKKRGDGKNEEDDDDLDHIEDEAIKERIRRGRRRSKNLAIGGNKEDDKNDDDDDDDKDDPDDKESDEEDEKKD